MTRNTRPYREALLEALADPAEAAAYLSVALEDSPEMFRKACLNVIQARKVAKVAREVGVSRESLYRSFAATGNPSQETVDSVLAALDLEYAGIRPKLGSTSGDDPSPTREVVAGYRRSRRTRRARVRSDQQLTLSYGPPAERSAYQHVALATSTAEVAVTKTRSSSTLGGGLGLAQIQQTNLGAAANRGLDIPDISALAPIQILPYIDRSSFAYGGLRP